LYLEKKRKFFLSLLSKNFCQDILQRSGFFSVRCRSSVVLYYGVATHLCVTSFFPVSRQIILRIHFEEKTCHLDNNIKIFCSYNMSPKINFSKCVAIKKGWNRCPSLMEEGNNWWVRRSGCLSSSLTLTRLSSWVTGRSGYNTIKVCCAKIIQKIFLPSIQNKILNCYDLNQENVSWKKLKLI
jgi:hypothetical protein